jgi:hypothetical protein
MRFIEINYAFSDITRLWRPAQIGEQGEPNSLISTWRLKDRRLGMSMGFGLYATAIGVGLVFAVLLTVAILSKALTGVFKEEGKPIGEDGNEKIAAVTAVIASMDESPEYGSGITGKGTSRWKTATRMEAMERREER